MGLNINGLDIESKYLAGYGFVHKCGYPDYFENNHKDEDTHGDEGIHEGDTQEPEDNHDDEDTHPSNDIHKCIAKLPFSPAAKGTRFISHQVDNQSELGRSGRKPGKKPGQKRHINYNLSSRLRARMDFDLTDRLRTRFDKLEAKDETSSEKNPTTPPRTAYQTIHSRFILVDNDPDNRLTSFKGHLDESPDLTQCPGCKFDIVADDHRIDHFVKSRDKIICMTSFHKECFLDPKKSQTKRGGRCIRCDKPFPSYKHIKTTDLVELAEVHHQYFGPLMELKLRQVRAWLKQATSMLNDKLDNLEEFITLHADVAEIGWEKSRRYYSLQEFIFKMVRKVQENALNEYEYSVRSLRHFTQSQEQRFNDERLQLVAGTSPLRLTIEQLGNMWKERCEHFLAVMKTVDMDKSGRAMYSMAVEHFNPGNDPVKEHDCRMPILFYNFMKNYEIEKGVNDAGSELGEEVAVVETEVEVEVDGEVAE